MADLPLNARGAVYHLDLRPEELAPTIITVGDPARVAMISQHFDQIEVERGHREFLSHTGYLGKKRVSVIATGIGVPCIDIVMNELDALVNMDLETRRPREALTALKIIRFGTAGALQPEIAPGDILLSRYALGLDNLLHYYQQGPAPHLQEFSAAVEAYFGTEIRDYYPTSADLSLFEHFSGLGIAGITATLGGFYAPQGRILRKPSAYPHLLERLAGFRFDGLPLFNCEMETAAIFGLGDFFGHQCLSLSVVVANRSTGAFVEDVPAKVAALVPAALEYVASLP